MKQVKINLTDELDFNEYRKQICFFSQKITSFRREGNSLIIECEDNANTDKIEKKANDALKKNLESKKEDIVIDEHLKKCKYHNDFYRDGFIKKNSGGFVSLEGDAVILYEFFDNEFRKIAEKLDAKEERYPILLGIDTMKDTGYYRRSPQYTMFCSDVTEDFEDLEKMSNASFVDKNLDEVIQIPSFSLSPSACFHVYEKYRGQTMPQNSVITLNQSVFRNEGRLNWEEFGRLRDYHVREIVFLGTQEFVEQTRENIREEVMTFIRKMNMDAYITVAADAFIMPKMIKYKKYQKMEKSKYEVRVSYDKDHTLAAASLNLHGTAFTSPFHIKVKGVDNPVSGCVGFGIERWILVFLAQYGTDSACWPDEVKKFIRQALINGSIDNRQLKDLAKKILNINKYKTVMLNELSINMMENGYDTIYINRIKELADLLYAEWSDYVTVSVSKIKRKRFDSPEAVTESIEKMEDEIVSITKGYIDFLEKDEGTDRENKKISNEIIFVEEGKIIFSITDGKTHNFWFEDKAPKYPLLKNCNDDKIFAKARILFNQESEENLYQAGIYVKSAEDKVYYMAIDNDRNCILDTIGENNRKEEFDNTNEYLIKMNLEADCLKVQFISDASTKELKMMIERLAPVEVGLMVKTWGNGGFLEVDFKESQAIISNK